MSDTQDPTPAEEIEIAIEREASPQDQAAEAIQELEVEIRNHTAGPAGSRQMALDLLRLIRENARRLSAQAAEQVQSVLKGGTSDYLDPDFWRGLGMVLDYQVKEIGGLIRRRARGEYTTDAYGMDSEIVELVRPIAGFLYRSWWRVEVSGLEHVPDAGGALLVANHAGVIPWDGAMLSTALLEDHPESRMTRVLHDRWVSAVPVLAPMLASLGQIQALPENAERLLGNGQVIAVFPEGRRGAAKIFRDRYQLTGFEVSEYVRAAMKQSAPIIPVAIIGAEETYPVIANLGRVAKMLGLPYLPITPLFPWFGPLGLIPLPTKWSLLFGKPIDTAVFGVAAADDSVAVARVADDLRERVRSLIAQGLAARESVF
jgi:1-acyl-sn-glycerol-3-phosphate acyltransferase